MKLYSLRRYLVPILVIQELVLIHMVRCTTKGITCFSSHGAGNTIELPDFGLILSIEPKTRCTTVDYPATVAAMHWNIPITNITRKQQTQNNQNWRFNFNSTLSVNIVDILFWGWTRFERYRINDRVKTVRLKYPLVQ